MAEEKDNMEQEKRVESSSVDDSIPPPGNEETMAQNIQDSRVHPAEQLTLAKTNQSEAEPEYPTLKKLIPNVIALYLAIFLVSLVYHKSHSVRLHKVMSNEKRIGPHNHRNRYSNNHR